MKTWKTKRKMHARENSTGESWSKCSCCKCAVNPPDWYVCEQGAPHGRKRRRKSWDRIDRENKTRVKGDQELARWDRNRLDRSEKRQQFTGHGSLNITTSLLYAALATVPLSHLPRSQKIYCCYQLQRLCS